MNSRGRALGRRITYTRTNFHGTFKGLDVHPGADCIYIWPACRQKHLKIASGNNKTFYFKMTIIYFCYFCSNETLTDQDIENKFTSLSLAFKTDKLTLTNRLELQQRQRDISEKNIESEISQLKKDIEVNILIFKVNKQLISTSFPFQIV